MMTALQFIDYYNRAGEIPAAQQDEFNSILDLLKNRYGQEYRQVVAEADTGIIDELISFREEFYREFHDPDAYENIIQTRIMDRNEQELISRGINDFCRRELILEMVEELAEKTASDRNVSPGLAAEQIDKLIREYNLTRADMNQLLTEKGTAETGSEKQERTLPEMLDRVIRDFQATIKAVFCVQLRFCSGSDSFPRRIWSSAQYKKYSLDIIQEDAAGNEFVFVLYANSPLGSGKLIVKTKEKKIKEFSFTDEKNTSRDFIYKGEIRDKEELYFLIKEK